MKDIAEFQAKYGIRIMVRRHGRYRNPGDDAFGGYSGRASLTYPGHLDNSEFGLTLASIRIAAEQGRKLAQLKAPPDLILASDLRRNKDGALATAEAMAEILGAQPQVYRCVAFTQPFYNPDISLVRELFEKYGDYACHRYLAGALEGHELFTEPADLFEARILGALMADWKRDNPVLVDANFDAVNLIYWRVFRDLSREEMPYQEGAWCPSYFAGLVFSEDLSVAAEFDADLTLVGEPRQVSTGIIDCYADLMRAFPSLLRAGT